MLDTYNGGEIVARDKSTGLFKPGHPKIGGKKKGYKSVKTVMREILMELACEKRDMKRVTLLEAMLYKQVEKAIKEADIETVKFILELAGELINNSEEQF